MVKVYSFPYGGLVFNDPSAPQKDTAVNAFLPALSVISMRSVRKKANPVVSLGEYVREGMMIGMAAGAGSVNVHATVPGKIIRKVSWKDRDGFDNEAFLIRMGGAFEKLGRKVEKFPWSGLSGYDLQKIIFDHGIVEMENSGRPLSEMISAARKVNKLTLVIRCVFDDPWLVADYALCKERLFAVIEGTAIIAKACLKVSQIIIAVSHPEKELGQELVSEAGRLNIPVSLVITCSRYPQRNKVELELALRTYEKKEALNLGSLLILGPAVLAATFDAVVHKKPILERYVAVGGTAVRHPQIMKVRIGTRIGELIEQCGGFLVKPERIVKGSPLSGREVLYLDEPVGKTCYAVAALSKVSVNINKQQNCINCGGCRAVCPVSLDPQNIYKRIKAHKTENVLTTECHGCGCCKIVCPSALPLMETILEKNREAAGV
ncbi:MAG: SLBB domain-containing protein [Treponema sp.]|jgi:electron transport complex protein RnfC|nr:SLBB domain-containing protein [Treponema sp.]